jgi:type V secretory pathway adhesin AidA
MPASVAAVSQQSPGYTAALAVTSDGNVSAGASDANNIFNGNFSGFTNLQVNSTVTKTGATLTSNVTLSATAPTMFLGVIRHPAIETSVVQVIQWS